MDLLAFNDAELTLYRDGEPVYRQPAIAHIGPDSTLFGRQALRIARLHPQQSNAQYLARLSADPLPIPGKLASNHADLVYLHLRDLIAGTGTESQSTPANPTGATAGRTRGKRRAMRLPWPARRGGDATAAERGSGDRIGAGPAAAQPHSHRSIGDADPGLVVAVPGVLSSDQLGVLLGIAMEAGIEVRGFVDSAVLMASTTALPAHAWLLDLHLTRACLTELRVTDEVTAAAAQELPGCGLMSCLDGWANLVADRFVQDTRFDPLHAADTEQQLYDQLYDWSLQTGSGENGENGFAARIQHGGHERHVQVPGAVLQRKLVQRFEQLAQKLPADALLLVAPESAAVPGLLAGLGDLGIQAEALAPQALVQGFLRHAPAIASGQLTLVSALPCGEPARAPVTDDRPAATHVLLDSRAWPLSGNPFGLPVAGRAGDTIGKDGKDLRLIAVEAHS